MFKLQFLSKTLSLALCSILVCTAGAVVALAADTPPNSPEKEGWNLAFSEEFNDTILDPNKFSDSYLPHWTTYEQSLAHYDVKDGIISLKIDKEGQGPWWHGSDIQKVSSIQTGMRDGMHYAINELEIYNVVGARGKH